MNQNHLEHHEHTHNHTIYTELMCHLPYAIFAVAGALSLLSIMNYVSTNTDLHAADTLFHSFHFMHIIFAATGTVLTFLRFSNSVPKAIAIGLISPTFFCVLSDAILPYVCGRLLGVHMHFHICFWSELYNVLPFLFVGILNGFVLSKHHGSRQTLYALSSHALHIIISSLASVFYLVSHGFADWQTQIGLVFLSLIVAVVVPCTFSDVVVPMMVARTDAK